MFDNQFELFNALINVDYYYRDVFSDIGLTRILFKQIAPLTVGISLVEIMRCKFLPHMVVYKLLMFEIIQTTYCSIILTEVVRCKSFSNIVFNNVLLVDCLLSYGILAVYYIAIMICQIKENVICKDGADTKIEEFLKLCVLEEV